ncbi:hypothetical protein ACFQX6_59820 [Streptosporangium lutulentum]
MSNYDSWTSAFAQTAQEGTTHRLHACHGDPHGDRRGHRPRGPDPAASAAELYSELYAEGFHGASTPAGLWKSSSPESGRAPCLTAAVSPAPPGSLPACAEGPYDRAGRGALRLTDGTGPETASLLLARKIPTGRGLTVEFDMYMWGGRKYTDGNGSRAGDGISFYVVDAARKQATAASPAARSVTGA